MGLQRIQVDVDEHIGLAGSKRVSREGRARHECGIVGIGQPVGFLDRIGVDAGEGFRRHVDEGGDVLLHEVRVRVVVDRLQPLAQFRLRFRQIGPNLPQGLDL
ncbi:hypothetical protein D9M68_534990 [compost metagenome]